MSADKRTAKDDHYRDRATGQYAYWNDFDRLCECGHRLGDHVAGGFECGLFDHTAGCQCQKFRWNGKRRTEGASATNNGERA
jgi:hypothetical protein